MNKQQLASMQKIVREEFRSKVNSGSRGCKDDEKERLLCKLTRIMNSLKSKSVNVSQIKPFIVIEWVDKVCLYLRRKEGTFNVINANQGFYAFQYFIHEVFEIRCLISKNLDWQDRDEIEKNNKKALDLCHAKALEAEYQFLTKIADSFGYSISFDTIFEKHPLFSAEEKRGTKDNDKRLLSGIGVEVSPVPSEYRKADTFFQELEKL